MKSPLLSDVYLRGALIASSLLFLISLGLSLNAFLGNTHLLIIHFTSERVFDVFGTKINIFYINALEAIVMGLNVALITALYVRVRTSAYILSFFNIFLGILILIAVAVIISVN